MLNKIIQKSFTLFIVTIMLTASIALADKPKYSADVPDSLLTTDKVEAKYLGELEFFDGMPSEETTTKVYDFLDISRAVDVFLNGMPGVSMYAMLEGLKESGLEPGDLALFEQLMDARSLFLTPNSTTMYAVTEVDTKNGPVVVEVPPGVLGALNDSFFRHVTDVGMTGPDQGKGGKYLFLPPGYEGEVSDEYVVVNSNTYRHWLFMRAFVKDGDLEGTAKGVRATYNSYPLTEAQSPPQAKIENLSGKQMNTIHANDATFYEELNAVIQYEPADAFNPELVGQFAAIGVKKGEAFEPDERMQKILTDAATIANASARAILFSPRNKNVYFYSDSQWYSPFAGGSHEFMDNGELVQNDRIMFHYYATGITPAMASPKVGTGSAYAIAARDAQGNFLDGGKTYKITMPTPIPVNNFWSFMVYSGQHRSMLETDQKTAGLDSMSPTMKANDDGSYTIWFGPEAPKGHEGNWIQTMPGKSYNTVLRLYGPLEPWFDKSWQPGEFMVVE